MSKYNNYQREQAHQKARTPHAVWRGIGFVMIILIPAMSYGIALLLLQQNAANGWVPLPKELNLPAALLQRGFPPDLLARIILTLAIAFVIFVVYNFIATIFLRAFGTPRYGPMDVPPIQGKIRKRD